MAKLMEKKDLRPADMMLLDSGTSSHMTPLGDIVKNRTECDISIALADDFIVEANEKGNRTVKWYSNDGPVKVTLSETLVAPDTTTSLISVSALVKKGINVLFMPGRAVLIDMKDNMAVLGYAKQVSDGLYYMSECQNGPPVSSFNEDKHQVRAMMALTKEPKNRSDDDSATDLESSSDSESSNESEESDSDERATQEFQEDKNRPEEEMAVKNPAETWHLRLGHSISMEQSKRHIRGGILPKVQPLPTGCTVCVQSKYRNRCQGSLTSVKTVGHLHVDTKGKIEKTSNDGNQYFLTIVDEMSRYTHTVPIGKKSEASEAVLHSVKKFQKQTGHTVRSLHADNETEFLKAQQVLEADGVEITTTAGYTPPSNGLAERTHGIILAHARATLSQAKLP